MNNILKPFVSVAYIMGVLCIPVSCSQPQKTENLTPVYTYKVVNTYPHDPQAFTQGLVFDNGFLYEGTGLYGKSSLRKTVSRIGSQVPVPEPIFSKSSSLVYALQ